MTPIQDILSQTATFLLAGGRGARLAPLTIHRSKPAVPFGDHRINDFALANCLRSSLAHDIGRNVLPDLVKRRNLAAFRFEDPETRRPRYWKDVGTIDSYYEASMNWLDSLPGSHRLAGSDSIIAEGVRIHRTAEVTDSIVMPGVEIGAGTRVRHVILDENVRVLAGARLGCETVESQAFTRTAGGVVVVPANRVVPAASGIYTVPRQRQIRLEPQIAR